MIDLVPGSSRWITLDGPEGVQLELWVADGSRPGPSVLLTAGIHGDEFEGPVALAELTRCLTPDELSGRLIVIPVVNQPAFEANSRVTPRDGINLARVFPGLEQGGPTERLAAVLFRKCVEPADFVIDLHSGGVEYEFLPMACFYDDPEPANQSYAAARRFGLPVLWQLPDTPGVLSREAWRRGKIAFGAEYGGGGRLVSAGVRAYLEGIQSTLEYWGCLPLADRASAAEPEVYRGNWVLSPADGFFVPVCCLGDKVAKGVELAHILDRRGGVQDCIMAGSDGRVLGLRSLAHIARNDWAVLVGVPQWTSG